MKLQDFSFSEIEERLPRRYAPRKRQEKKSKYEIATHLTVLAKTVGGESLRA